MGKPDMVLQPEHHAGSRAGDNLPASIRPVIPHGVFYSLTVANAQIRLTFERPFC